MDKNQLINKLQERRNLSKINKDQKNIIRENIHQNNEKKKMSVQRELIKKVNIPSPVPVSIKVKTDDINTGQFKLKKKCFNVSIPSSYQIEPVPLSIETPPSTPRLVVSALSSPMLVTSQGVPMTPSPTQSFPEITFVPQNQPPQPHQQQYPLSPLSQPPISFMGGLFTNNSFINNPLLPTVDNSTTTTTSTTTNNTITSSNNNNSIINISTCDINQQIPTSIYYYPLMVNGNNNTYTTNQYQPSQYSVQYPQGEQQFQNQLFNSTQFMAM